jgi:hypothetical protein
MRETEDDTANTDENDLGSLVYEADGERRNGED